MKSHIIHYKAPLEIFIIIEFPTLYHLPGQVRPDLGMGPVSDSSGSSPVFGWNKARTTACPGSWTVQAPQSVPGCIFLPMDIFSLDI